MSHAHLAVRPFSPHAGVFRAPMVTLKFHFAFCFHLASIEHNSSEPASLSVENADALNRVVNTRSGSILAPRFHVDCVH